MQAVQRSADMCLTCDLFVGLHCAGFELTKHACVYHRHHVTGRSMCVHMWCLHVRELTSHWLGREAAAITAYGALVRHCHACICWLFAVLPVICSGGIETLDGIRNA